MKTMPALLAGFGELRVLGQEAVARMDRLRPGLLGGVEDALADEIDLARGGRADAARPRRPGAHGAHWRRPRNTRRRWRRPMRRGVLMTRQAISPRLAIRIFLNMACLRIHAGSRTALCIRPTGRFVEEGAQCPPEPRSSRVTLRCAARCPRSRHRRSACWPPRGSGRSQRIGRADRPRAAPQRSRCNLRVQFLGRHDFVDQADFAGARQR